MELFKRDEAINDILEFLDIPRFVHCYERFDGIGPQNPSFFNQYAEMRFKREEDARAVINSLTDEEVWQLREAPKELDHFARRNYLFKSPPWYAGGFGVKSKVPDFSYWAKMDYWTNEEATCLSIGFIPETIPNFKRFPGSPYAALTFYWKRLELVTRANFPKAAQPDTISPPEFIKWLRNKKIEFPKSLDQEFPVEELIVRPAMLSAVDARKHDSALKALLGLISTHYGYRNGKMEKDIADDVLQGLSELALTVDRKTLKKLFEDTEKSLARFVDEQHKRDSKPKP